MVFCIKGGFDKIKKKLVRQLVSPFLPYNDHISL